MKKLHSLWLVLGALTLALVVGCASGTSLLTQETIAMRSVTSARTVATAALRAGKITLAEDQRTQASLTLVAIGIKAAVAAQDASAVAERQREAEAIQSTLEKK